MTSPRREVDPGRVERVARAIYDHYGENETSCWEDAGDALRDEMRGVARAALTADAGEARQAVERYPCYCLPGSARCDDPYAWCDRSEQLDGVRERVRALAEKWESQAQRYDDAEPVSTDGLSRMILAARLLREHAADLRAALDPT